MTDEKKDKGLSPFDFAKSIDSKDYIFENEKEYNAYMVNKALSFGPDTILYANDMNQLYFLDKKLQYDYLFHSIRKAKRYNKWVKKLPNNEDINIIATYYNCSLQKAKSALTILTVEQIAMLKQEQEMGGTKK
ncbi:MAG: DNA polymerase clamp loader subunit A [Legionella sp.]|uniref:DNA polymerase clamp loader subunit A n=1 Tax=Legionella sp. TaxID=459 RepID=UPI002848ED43|nr:DNA polymerase clamp loader subunit A [Legionella sp.]